ncbi:FKBP-type peptidyl-prolyl cis-trans isomerase [Marinifilum sp. D714]|uniref:FKBP-type peptidyl-prolyl cis-trans isomerase n=1 Tax=Marinifilum sp. D714 TaxID=2937523 RepID=UPI0027CBB0A4|nr:FKBP-type peptidyl-prolyl cis-trans isomerase [Marinifilum sp. D714]MDQ2178123.1 FKBP-type peptidyl-prolyl cis-trans isomerase [Marinifilum sp. D714]
MKLKALSLALGLGAMTLVSCNQNGNKDVALNNQIDSVSYSIGINFGTNLKKSNITEFNEAAILAGIYDVIEGDSLKIELRESGSVINNYMRALQTKIGEENIAKGEKFLSENAKKEGVITTASGLQYRVITEGTGEKPAATDQVKVHYRGTTIDGKEFDSSFKRNQPATFAANRVIKGWTEALQLMPVGSKYELFIPAKLAYGPRGAGGDIGPNETLIFEVELLEIVTPAEPKK